MTIFTPNLAHAVVLPLFKKGTWHFEATLRARCLVRKQAARALRGGEIDNGGEKNPKGCKKRRVSVKARQGKRAKVVESQMDGSIVK